MIGMSTVSPELQGYMYEIAFWKLIRRNSFIIWADIVLPVLQGYDLLSMEP